MERIYKKTQKWWAKALAWVDAELEDNSLAPGVVVDGLDYAAAKLERSARAQALVSMDPLDEYLNQTATALSNSRKGAVWKGPQADPRTRPFELINDQ
jgi:hypothetical protein